eukprot:Pgem_evm1s5657
MSRDVIDDSVYNALLNERSEKAAVPIAEKKYRYVGTEIYKKYSFDEAIPLPQLDCDLGQFLLEYFSFERTTIYHSAILTIKASKSYKYYVSEQAATFTPEQLIEIFDTLVTKYETSKNITHVFDIVVFAMGFCCDPRAKDMTQVFANRVFDYESEVPPFIKI